MSLESLIMVTAWPKVFDRRLSTTIGFGRVCFGLVRAGDEAESHRFGPNTVVMLVGGKRVHLNFIANVVAIHTAICVDTKFRITVLVVIVNEIGLLY